MINYKESTSKTIISKNKRLQNYADNATIHKKISVNESAEHNGRVE